MIICNRDCEKCKQLNVKVDKQGYPWGYEWLKYGDSVFQKKFKDTKEFLDFSTRWIRHFNRQWGDVMTVQDFLYIW